MSIFGETFIYAIVIMAIFGVGICVVTGTEIPLPF